MNNYLVTFAKGTPQEVTYPVEAWTKRAAKEEFSRQYIGRVDATLVSLVKAVQVEDDDTEN